MRKIVDMPTSSAYVIPFLNRRRIRINKGMPFALEVIRVCEKYFNYTYDQLKNKDRHRELVFARHCTMYFIRKETNLSLVSIGRNLFDRDHTSIIHALNTIDDLLSYDCKEKRSITELSFIIENHLI